MIDSKLIKIIQPEFDKLICLSQNIKAAHKHLINSTPLLEEWAKNKKRFYDMFGETLIYDTGSKVVCDISHEEKQELLDGYLDELEWAKEAAHDLKLKQQLAHLYEFLNVLHIDEFFNNKISYTYRNYNVKTGCKTIKSFKVFFSPEYKEELYRWQQKASELIQKGKVTGYLKFSVHPLDFLTISENNHNWSSCHSLHGDYAGGNLDYLTDSSTFIAYLSSTQDNNEPLSGLADFKWNSKKWRMLVYVNDNKHLVFLGREYPFSNMCLVRKTKQFISKVILGDEMHYAFDEFNWHHSYDKISQSCNNDKRYSTAIKPSFFINDRIIQVNNLINCKSYPLHFNDLLYSSFYLPEARIDPNFVYDEDTIEIGGKSWCAFCGKEEVRRPEMYLCDACAFTHSLKLPDGYCRCDHCGEILDEGSSFWLDDFDIVVCKECYDKIERNDY